MGMALRRGLTLRGPARGPALRNFARVGDALTRVTLCGDCGDKSVRGGVGSEGGDESGDDEGERLLRKK